MHILNITPQYWPYMGGAAVYVHEMARRFVHDGHQIDVYTTNAWDLQYLFFPDRSHIKASEEWVEGVHVRRFPVFHAAQNKVLRNVPDKLLRWYSDRLYRLHIAFVPGLWRELIRGNNNYDLIHATPSPHFYLVYPALLAARRLGVPFVFTPFIHTGTPRGVGQFEVQTSPRRIAVTKKADLLIVQTSIEKEALMTKGVPEEKMAILGMGVNPEGFSGGDGWRFRKEYGIKAEEALMIFVGAIIRDKGCFQLLNAFRMLRERGVPIRFAMAGHPSLEFQRYFDSQPPQIKEACVMLGNIKGRKKKDLFLACDVLAMPSKTDSYGIAFLEAMLAKKPVIGCFAGGVPEVISDGEDGFLVPFGDSHMLSEYISILIKNSELARRMGERGYKKVLSGCTWDKRYEKLKGEYERLVGDEG